MAPSRNTAVTATMAIRRRLQCSFDGISLPLGVLIAESDNASSANAESCCAVQTRRRS
jgi:hypothetical protein